MTGDRPDVPAAPQERAVSRRRFVASAALWSGAAAVPPWLGAHGAVAPARQGSASAAGRAQAFVAALGRQPPFSFAYGPHASATLLARWPLTQTQTALDAARTSHRLTWREPGGGLVVRCEAVAYHNFPTVEWTVHFQNTGPKPSPLLSEVLALDTMLRRGMGAEYLVHTCNGSAAVTEDFGLVEVPLPPRSFKLFTCVGGRPMSGYLRLDPHLLALGFPYFNIDWGGQGAIVVIGWPGQWAAEMARDGGNGLRLRAGMTTRDGAQLRSGDGIHDAALTSVALRPGEEIRTPRVVMQFWQGGGWLDAQNVWRGWMRAHNMPRPGGHLPAPMCPAQAGDISLTQAAADELGWVQEYVAGHLAAATGGVYDHWWIDAGWYVVPPEATDWSWTGTWQPDPARYPRGLRPVTNAARAAGMKSIIWHEPERVRPDTWLYNQAPQWLLGPGPDGDARLLNLGHPQAWRWVVEHFDGLIGGNGVDVYRHDFNIDPLAYWNQGDAPDRQGMTQIRYVTGFLAFWDELLRRHPGLLIDACASGGRRLDVETVRRAVTLWRSDQQGEAVSEQCHTYGLSLWLPYHGTGVGLDDSYLARSAMLPSYLLFLRPDGAPSGTLDLARRMTREWRAFAGDLLGDYYPLTPYSTATDVWIAWQFQRPEIGTGVVQAFRRDDNTTPTLRLTLRELTPGATYEIKNADEAGVSHATGHALMTAGLMVRLKVAHSAATITYRRRA